MIVSIFIYLIWCVSLVWLLLVVLFIWDGKGNLIVGCVRLMWWCGVIWGILEMFVWVILVVLIIWFIGLICWCICMCGRFLWSDESWWWRVIWYWMSIVMLWLVWMCGLWLLVSLLYWSGKCFLWCGWLFIWFCCWLCIYWMCFC